MNSLAKKVLVREVLNSQLPNLIGEIERKLNQHTPSTSFANNGIRSNISKSASAIHSTTEIAFDESDVNRLTGLLLDSTPGSFEAAIALLRAHGKPIDEIVLDLIPAIARDIGKHWETDTASFAEVSIAVGKLERIIYKLDYLFQATQQAKKQNKSILISTCPDSQHTLGTLILANYFTFSGWNAIRPSKNTLDGIIQAIESSSYQALALSVSTFEQLTLLPDLIELLRKKSRNQQIIIAVGGPIYNVAPDNVAHIKAEVKAFTAEECVQKLEQYIGQFTGQFTGQFVGR